MSDRPRQWNSTIPMRSAPLPRGKPPQRKTRVKPKGRKGSLFPKRRDPDYCAWIRTLPCCVPAMTVEIAMALGRKELRLPAKWLRCWPQCAISIKVWAEVDPTHPISECAHVVSRGAGGDDRANTVPLCMRHHRQQHAVGIETFQRTYGLDLAAIAADLAAGYPGETDPQ